MYTVTDTDKQAPAIAPAGRPACPPACPPPLGGVRGGLEPGEAALSLFIQGYGCCQSVVAAFAERYGMDRDMALRVAAGFGGGVGRMRMMCGACSALTILAGLEKGQTRGDDREGKADCYQFTRDLLEAFRQENGSIICAELLQMAGCKAVTDTNQPDDRNAEYYKRRPCARKVVSAARIFEQYLTEGAVSQETK